jgi:uncharacterized protein DUF1588
MPRPGLSIRERLAEHSGVPACRACHEMMDPIGFGFENYDGLGRFRTSEGGKPVDARGTLTMTDVDGPFTKVNIWYAEQVAYLVGKMDAVVESNGKTMLDNSLVIWTNGLGKGNNHSRQNIPYVLLGSAGGYLATGRYLQFDNAHNDLLVSIMNAMGLRDEKTFGDASLCKGPLPGLAA